MEVASIALLVDTERLARAAQLQVRPLGSGLFEVTGGAHAHTVRLPHPWCDCEDYRRGKGARFCKHLLAVAISQATDEERVEIAAMLGIG